MRSASVCRCSPQAKPFNFNSALRLFFVHEFKSAPRKSSVRFSTRKSRDDDKNMILRTSLPKVLRKHRCWETELRLEPAFYQRVIVCRHARTKYRHNPNSSRLPAASVANAMSDDDKMLNIRATADD
jgi:hypothetical protein